MMMARITVGTQEYSHLDPIQLHNLLGNPLECLLPSLHHPLANQPGSQVRYHRLVQLHSPLLIHHHNHPFNRPHSLQGSLLANPPLLLAYFLRHNPLRNPIHFPALCHPPNLPHIPAQVQPRSHLSSRLRYQRHFLLTNLAQFLQLSQPYNPRLSPHLPPLQCLPHSRGAVPALSLLHSLPDSQAVRQRSPPPPSHHHHHPHPPLCSHRNSLKRFRLQLLQDSLQWCQPASPVDSLPTNPPTHLPLCHRISHPLYLARCRLVNLLFNRAHCRL